MNRPRCILPRALTALRYLAIATSSLLLAATLSLWAWTQHESEMVEWVGPAAQALDGVHRQSSWGLLSAQEGVMLFTQEARLILEHEEDGVRPIGPAGYRRRPLPAPTYLAGLPAITAVNRQTWSGFDGEWYGFMYQRWDGGEPTPPSASGWNFVSRKSGMHLAVPWWLLVALFAQAPAWAWWRGRQRLLRKRPGHCPNCGYDMRGTPERCPECGRLAPGA